MSIGFVVPARELGSFDQMPFRFHHSLTISPMHSTDMAVLCSVGEIFLGRAPPNYLNYRGSWWVLSIILLSTPRAHLCLIFLVASFGASERYVHMRQHHDGGEEASVLRWCSISIGLSIIFNITTTSLIAGRIWWSRRNATRAIRDSKYGTVSCLNF